MLIIANDIVIDDSEFEWSAMRAQGAGGQNVNKVSSAVHLRFDVGASALPQYLKDRILELRDQRLTKDGVLVIKAQTFRSQDKNLAVALERLADIVRAALVVQKPRRATRPTHASKKRRLEGKRLVGETKAGRKKVSDA